jgi:dissimilatory sulfite reductase related protein
MPSIQIAGKELEIDEEGFMQEPEKWTQEIAEGFGKSEAANCAAGKMTEDHWKIVNYIRNYFTEYDIAPPIRMLVKQTGIDLAKINQLFPKGPAMGACKVAGLPKPTGCV